MLCLVLTGCGGGGDEKPKPIEGPAKEVAGVVERLERATARQDFATICEELLASSTRRQAGGDDCTRVLAERAGAVRRPRIVIEAIEVRGATAEVRVRTTARGQASVKDVIQLVREGGRYRIAALG